MAQRRHAVLAAVSRGCPPPNDKSLRDPHPSATEARKPPCDLHVLSMPPAFALSQDQTLKFIRLSAPARALANILRSHSDLLFSFLAQSPSAGSASRKPRPTAPNPGQSAQPALARPSGQPRNAGRASFPEASAPSNPAPGPAASFRQPQPRTSRPPTPQRRRRNQECREHQAHLLFQ